MVTPISLNLSDINVSKVWGHSWSLLMEEHPHLWEIYGKFSFRGTPTINPEGDPFPSLKPLMRLFGYMYILLLILWSAVKSSLALGGLRAANRWTWWRLGRWWCWWWSYIHCVQNSLMDELSTSLTRTTCERKVPFIIFCCTVQFNHLLSVQSIFEPKPELSKKASNKNVISCYLHIY